jgi:CheY-like chemotaxis protein
LSVGDTGCGIERDTISKIFDPFFTTKAPGTGTGLGLSMVYGAMDQAGGHILVYSEVGKGTIFKLYFPTIDADVEQPFLPKTDVAMGRGTETVLLVEDEANLRQVTQELLESEGYRVLAAEDGEKALDYTANYMGPIDVLLTDIVLPGISGREIAERISAMRPALKVLFMSGYTGALIAKQGVLDPGVALLSKPFSKNELLAQIRSVLDRQDGA